MTEINFEPNAQPMVDILSIALLDPDNRKAKYVSVSMENVQALLGLVQELEQQRATLGTAIAEMATNAGILDGTVPVGGPALLMLCQDMATMVKRNVEEERVAFEEAVFKRYFISQIIRTGKGGPVEFVPQPSTLSKLQLLERAGDDYKREDISAMWWGWRKALSIDTEVKG